MSSGQLVSTSEAGGKMWGCLPPSCCPVRTVPWVSKQWLPARVEFSNKSPNAERKVKRESSVPPTEDGSWSSVMTAMGILLRR